MNSNEKNLEREFLINQFLAKEFVQKEREEKEKQARKISYIFQKANAKDIFKLTSSIESGKNLNNFTNYDINFIYYQLNCDYLKTLAINLKHLDSRLFISKNGKYIIFVEYYLNTENDSIIFVKYHFKHIKLHSTNNKINLNTFVFVNSKSEIYYYDNSSSDKYKLLKEFETNMNIKHAKELFNKKKFAVSPSQETRTYKLISTKNPDLFEEKKLKDIHLIPKQLLDNLLNSLPNIFPASSEFKIETNFLGYTEKPVTIQTKITNTYNDFGVIEVSEKLLEYEIVLYFLSNSDKKVKAKFYLTEAEKDGYLILTEKLLENAIFENYNDVETFPKILDTLVYLYKENCINKNFSEDSNKNIQRCIVKLISEYITVEKTLYEHSDLKDTFKNICIEFCKINTSDFPQEYSFNQIRNSKLEYKNERFMQSFVYSIIYEESLYLIEICANYEIYQYEDCSFEIFLPVFGISNIELNIFKPIKQTEIDDFLAKNLEKSSLTRFKNFSKSVNPLNIYEPIMQNLTNIFPDFVINSENLEKNYDITKIYHDRIYNKILNCIKNQTTTTSHLKCSLDQFDFSFPVYEEDDDEIKIQFPISYNNIIYGYYITSTTKIYVNSSFENTNANEYSTGNNLLVADFNKNIPFRQTTTLHTLIKNYYYFRQRKNCDILKLSNGLMNYEFPKFCIDFLLKKQENETL